MSRVFISHKWEEKEEAKKLKAYLESCFISCWLDESNLQAGNTLTNEILQNINDSQYLVAMVSERYLDSPYCKLEFDYAFHQKTKHNYNIIIVTLGDRHKLIEKAKQKGLLHLVFLLEGNTCKAYNQYDPEPIFESVGGAINESDPIKFKPLRTIHFGKIPAVLITADHDNLDSDLLSKWSFNILDFLAKDKNDPKPLKRNHAIAFSGVKPGWLISFFTIPLANNRDVFVYNQPKQCFICVYAMDKSSGLLGTVFNYEI